MASEIERAIYGEWADHVTPTGEVGDQCLLEFAISRDARLESDIIRLRVAPWECQYRQGTIATFSGASLTQFVQLRHDPEDLEMPWSIIGFHDRPIEGGQWLFNLNCHEVRWTWASDWPSVELSRAK